MHLDFLNSGILLAIIAHGLIGISLIWDKVLLQRPATKSLPNYVFWLGAISIFGLLLMPFGFHMPALDMVGLGFGAGVIHLGANWFYYRALKEGEASQTLAVMGGFSPLATGLIAIPLLSKPFGEHSVLAFGLMVGGGFVMFFSETLSWRKVVPNVLWASGLFGLTNVLQKVVFNTTGFISGYVFFTLGTFAGAMLLLVPPSWRRQIFEHSEDAPPRSRFWYFVNRFLSGVGSFLIFFAISRGSPAVIDAISGVRYVIIFLGAYLLTRMRPDWLKEDFQTHALIGKSIATGLIVAGLVLVGTAEHQGGGAGASIPFPYTVADLERSRRPSAEMAAIMAPRASANAFTSGLPILR